MRKIWIALLLVAQLFAAKIETPLVSLDETNETGTINEKVDVGMSGFIVKKLSNEHSVILSNVVVSAFNSKTQEATLKITPNIAFINEALPHINSKVKVGDIVLLAFNYDRAVLIAPSENVYYDIVKRMKIQWVHPDIFATVLSMNGHPTPLYADFQDFSELSGVGLMFLFLEKKLYTLDIKSFKILNISDAPFEVKNQKLPFYTRIDKIEANWFGEGNQELKEYKQHYYKLLINHNKKSKKLYEIVKKSENQTLLELFEKKEEK